MADKRCGKCGPCLAKPPRPCDVWVKKAISKLQKEFADPRVQKHIKETLDKFDKERGK